MVSLRNAVGPRIRIHRRSLFIVVAIFCSSQTSLAQFSQQAELVGSGAINGPGQITVALSSDGNTALVGARGDNGTRGAVWVFARNEGVWRQQGAKLVGTGANGAAAQGSSIALSADGNTALVGGPGDGVWVFIRSGGLWIQQGGKLTVSDATGSASLGSSVALSADGNTAIIGGSNDDSNQGAAWIFTRSGGVWSEQRKLVGTGQTGAAFQGASVALSADANTAIVGGPGDNSNQGATWVFTRSVGVWSQQAKLIGMNVSGTPRQGASVALSADGDTAVVGGPNNAGPNNASNTGGAWVFTRSSGRWSQSQTSALQPFAPAGAPLLGLSVSLSADGNTAILGGPSDDMDPQGLSVAAAWVFVRSSGGAWSQQGRKYIGSTGGLNAELTQGRSVSMSADGNTFAIGGAAGSPVGPVAWVFTKSQTAPAPAASVCLWAKGTFSQGAQFCIASSIVLTCDRGEWTPSTYGPCNAATPVAPK
jgi:FG-GAP repeat